jgi:hypothetical protein
MTSAYLLKECFVMEHQFSRRIEVVSLKREKNLTTSSSMKFMGQEYW